MANEFDELIPNTQTPRQSTIGTSGNVWNQVHAGTVSCDALIVSGLSLATYDDSMVQAELFGIVPLSGPLPPPPSSYIVVHNLGTEFVDVQFYDVRKRAKVSVDEGDIKKKKYTRTTKNGSTQTRYAVVAEVDGSKLTKFVSEEYWKGLDVPEVT